MKDTLGDPYTIYSSEMESLRSLGRDKRLSKDERALIRRLLRVQNNLSKLSSARAERIERLERKVEELKFQAPWVERAKRVCMLLCLWQQGLGQHDTLQKASEEAFAAVIEMGKKPRELKASDL